MAIRDHVSSGVHLRDVTFSYPKAIDPALEQLSWEIRAGDFVVVTGSSGSGKSTMLRCLNGLVPHFSGGRFAGVATVFGLDTRLRGPRDLSSHVGFVFQDPEAQAVARYVEDDIAFGLEQAGLPRHLMRKRVEEVLDLLGIAALRQRDITTLSGGERQRVAIAGAMVLQPDLLVLDEPTSQLDPWGAEEVLTALHRLNDELGLTVVLAEHRLDRVAAYADTMRVVRRGGLPIDAPPAEALTHLPEHDQPPLAQLAIRAGWSEVPLTIKAARRMLTTTAPATDAPTRRAAGETVVAIERVDIDRGDRPVLRDLSLEIHRGEIAAIMGRNGSGKSTLIRAILGMLPLRAGRISVAGREITPGDLTALAGIAGYLPQDPAQLLFAERVIDELAFTLEHLPARGDRDVRNTDDLLDELGLSALSDRHPRDLSVGERERAALAAVLVGSPELFLLDEPTRGMDGSRKQALMAVLDRERERGAAVVMATHDVELVAAWADRVILLGDGEIIADGPPGDVLAGSLTFSTQINRLFGGHALTVQDALAILNLVSIP